MIYAKLWTYTDSNGVQQTTIAARPDQPDSTWVAYNVPDATWLYITVGVIAVYTTANYVPPPLPPNSAGFEQAVKTALGGALAANSLAMSYPLFFPAVANGVWSDVQAFIIDANTKILITSTQYTAIKAAAAANYIPITLP